MPTIADQLAALKVLVEHYEHAIHEMTPEKRKAILIEINQAANPIYNQINVAQQLPSPTTATSTAEQKEKTDELVHRAERAYTRHEERDVLAKAVGHPLSADSESSPFHSKL